MKVKNTMDVRIQNAHTIVKELEIQKKTTNTEIASKYGLSFPTVANILNILKKNDLIITAGSAQSSGGRRPTLISLNPDYKYFIGINITKHVIYAVLVNFIGEVILSKTHYHDFDENEEYWNLINSICEDLLDSVGHPISVQLGVALPGIVDYDKQCITGTETLEVTSIDFSGILHYLGENTVLNDSARLAGIAQLYGKELYPNSVFLLLSRRIAGTLLINNEIFNLSKIDCNFGSMILDPNSTEDTYGPVGSFAAFCSASRIIDILWRQGYEVLYPEFFQGIEAGNEYFRNLWSEYLHNLALAIYNLRTILGIDIVIGGEMGNFLMPYYDELCSEIQRRDPTDCVREYLHFSDYGQYDDAYGAALYARSQFLSDNLSDLLKAANE